MSQPTHASEEMISAMRGYRNRRFGQDPGRVACTPFVVYSTSTVRVSLWGDFSGNRDDRREVTCRDCLALFPADARVRMDELESRPQSETK